MMCNIDSRIFFGLEVGFVPNLQFQPKIFASRETVPSAVFSDLSERWMTCMQLQFFTLMF